MEIYIQQGPNRQGPYTLDQVHNYYAQGVFTGDDLAWNSKDPTGAVRPAVPAARNRGGGNSR